MKHVFNVPITLNLRVEVEAFSDNVDEERSSAAIVAQVVADRARDVLIPKPGAVRVTATEVGYPEEDPGGGA